MTTATTEIKIKLAEMTSVAGEDPVDYESLFMAYPEYDVFVDHNGTLAGMSDTYAKYKLTSSWQNAIDDDLDRDAIIYWAVEDALKKAGGEVDAGGVPIVFFRRKDMTCFADFAEEEE